MKKLFVLLALVMGAMSVNAQHLGSEYRLKKVIPVAGRQGIAVDKDYFTYRILKSFTSTIKKAIC